MSYQVALLNFEGPLDLLLQLVERSRFEVSSIRLGDITGQYIAHIEQLDDISPDDLHQFLALAARLMLLKSRALLPEANITDESDEVAELRAQLDEYRNYQSAGNRLLELIKSPAASLRRRTADRLPESVLPAPANVSGSRLASAFSEVLRRMPPVVTIPESSSIEIDDFKANLGQKLRSGAVNLSDWLGSFKSRIEVIVGFMALLELLRHGEARAIQDNPFGDIIISNE